MKTNTGSSKKVINLFTLVMINIIAVDSLRSLPYGAEYGFSLLFYYLIAGICFFLPIALITAELATTWPKTGGLYVWVKQAFGVRWAFFAIWMQWIYNVVWYPTILAFLAGTVAYLVDPSLVNNKVFMLVTVLILFWLATLINYFGMKASGLFSVLGALLGTLLPILFIITLGAMWILEGQHSQLSLSWQTLTPNLQSPNNLAFLCAVLFGLIGLEMSATHAEEVKNPAKNYPRALLISAVLIWSSLVLGSFAIAMVVPSAKLNLVSGLMEAFTLFFKHYHMPWMDPVIAGLIVIGGISGVGAWLIGPAKGMLVAARDGAIPPALCKVNQYGAPTNILLLQGVVFTIMCSVFLLMPSVNSSYWILSAMTAQLALITYLFMFAAAIKLRYQTSTACQTYRVPGGKVGIWLVAGLGMVSCIVATLLGFYPPSQMNVGAVITYEIILFAGVILFCLAPIVIYACRKKHWH